MKVSGSEVGLEPAEAEGAGDLVGAGGDIAVTEAGDAMLELISALRPLDAKAVFLVRVGDRESRQDFSRKVLFAEPGRGPGDRSWERFS